MDVQGILETAIYVSDMPRAVAFYRRLFDFQTLDETDQFHAFDVAGRSVLLLFTKGTTGVAKQIPGGVIPPHAGDSPTHFAFAITADELPSWESALPAAGVPIESIVRWSRGGTSLYFRDPDDNLVELATPGVWASY